MNELYIFFKLETLMSNYSLTVLLEAPFIVVLGKCNGLLLHLIPGKLFVNKLELSTPSHSCVIDCPFDCFCDLFV